ncbi:MAG TPA: bacteriohemerythrin [Anaerolineales bacterium]|nr:bacteriohemerythrin [Anaerolineales bacterium]
MEKILWDQSLSVGIEEIDQQHKQLVKMLNQLIELDGVTVASETISDTLTRMTEYADYHFTSEEQYMEQIQYPEFESHKKQHIEFMRKTAELSMGTMEYKESIPADLLTYLKDWLINHIMESDMKIKSYLQAQERS